MASTTDIFNRALQKLGAKRISDPDEDSVNARALRSCYSSVRDAELRKHPWQFAVRRAQLAADATAPEWGRSRRFQLPADYIRLAEDYAEDNSLYKDWVIEGKYIYTDDGAPLYLRYIARIEDTSQYDALFVEALSSKLAYETCEQLTQSNSKKAEASEDYKYAIAEAKRVNGIEKRAQVTPDSEWITERF